MHYFNHISIHSISTGLHAVYTKIITFCAPVVYGSYPVAINLCPTGLSVSKLRRHICFISVLCFGKCRAIHSHPHPVPQGRVIKVSILRCMANCRHIRRPETKRVLTENTRVLDYVFVDEHNRHKRLKGMRSVCVLDWWASI